MFKKFLLLTITILTCITTQSARAQQNTTTRFFQAYAYENITVDNTVGGVQFTSTNLASPTIPANFAQLVQFTVNCNTGTSCPIHFTLDGTAPTTSVGLRVDYGQSVAIYTHGNLTKFAAIREGATSAILNVQYFK